MISSNSARAFGSLGVHLPLAHPGERIGVMGGSFNPPHEGHVLAARAALARLGIDRLWVVVTPGNPLKDRNALPPLAERMAAVRAVLPERRIVVTGFEAGLATSYTADTLRFIALRMPAVRFVWIMGADNLASFHRWQRWQSIAASVPIAVVDRPGWRHRALASPAARALWRWRIPERDACGLAMRPAPCWVYLTTRLSDASSTALRRQSGISLGLTAE